MLALPVIGQANAAPGVLLRHLHLRNLERILLLPCLLTIGVSVRDIADLGRSLNLKNKSKTINKAKKMSRGASPQKQ